MVVAVKRPSTGMSRVSDTWRGPWRTVDRVEVATLEWVDWFNHRRLYKHCGDLPPARPRGLLLPSPRGSSVAEFSPQ
ncbi:MAG: hypothetical protein EOP32_18905 [Rhodococcus sp. (in: high G+C Gram-positive bacteria)]|nr:MAG: hypothetical protein EOP32_18905 [Rhodococcus sp. (in: high G+C Gram-positive bacteria)]